MDINEKTLLTIEDACQLSGLSRKTIKKVFENHMVRIEGLMKPRIKRATFDEVMRGRKEKQSGKAKA